MQGPRGFVKVSHDRTRFEEPDGRPFFVAGANCYYLLTRAADPGLRHECTRVLDDAAAAGLTVLRLWAFADGDDQWNALQPRPGLFEERVFQAMDWLLAEAGARGLRLLLVLTNYWPDYGGMRRYVAWACAERGQQPPSEEGEAAEPFYADPDCQRMFRVALAAVVQRVNSLTGVTYRDDPTILGWGLANEPRCAGDTSCATIPRWAHQTAAFLKALDPHHLVTVDCEGFLGPSTPDACSHNPYSCAASGCDFASDCGSPAIDFACCHLYPELWLPATDEQEQLRFALSWLDCHVALSRRLGKPLMLSEFGKRRGGLGGDGQRADYYQQVLGAALGRMQAGDGLAGTSFWMMAAPSYPDHDGFTVYFSGQPSSTSHGTATGIASSTAGDDRTAAIIKQHAAAVAALNQRVPAPAADHLNPLLPVSFAAGSVADLGVARGTKRPAKAKGEGTACPGCPCM